MKKARFLRSESNKEPEQPLYLCTFFDPYKIKLDVGLKVKFYRFWHRYADDTGRPHLKEIRDLENIVRILSTEINANV